MSTFWAPRGMFNLGLFRLSVPSPNDTKAWQLKLYLGVRAKDLYYYIRVMAKGDSCITEGRPETVGRRSPH